MFIIRVEEQAESIRNGYESDNPITILAQVFKGRSITPGQNEIMSAYRYTAAEICNASIGCDLGNGI